MAALTIRNLDESLKQALRRRAAGNDRSMEEEARVALRQWVAQPNPVPSSGLGTRLRKRFEAAGGVELDMPERAEARALPDFFDQ